MTRPRDIADSINRINSSAADATAVTIDSSERVGIGETSPTVPLEVKGAQGYASSASNLSTTTTKAAAKIRGSNDASTSLFFGSLTNDAEQYIQSSNGAGSAADTIALNPFGGNVLINTVTSTVDALTVAGNANANSLTLNGNSTTGQSYGALILAGTNGSDASLRVYNQSASSTYMFVRGDGNVGIGTAGGSTVKLFVIDTHASNYTQYVQNQSGSYAGAVQVLQSQRAATTAYSFLQAYASTDLEFHFRGDGNAFADGSFSGGGADYAEMFEWDDGNSSNEDRRGYSVVLTNGNKIRKATSDDAAADIIGIVSANPTVLGDSAWNMWDEKYNKDDFGGFVMETYTVTEWTEPAVFEDVEIEAVLDEEGNEIEPARTEQRKVSDKVEHSYETDKIPSDLTVPSDAVVSNVDADGNTLERRQLNSNYDDTQTYTPREERQEWDAVGMMGKLRMRSGQPTGDRWIKMRNITSDIEEWLVR